MATTSFRVISAVLGGVVRGAATARCGDRLLLSLLPLFFGLSPYRLGDFGGEAQRMASGRRGCDGASRGGSDERSESGDDESGGVVERVR